MAKKKILVTGVAGFIGSNLADRILKAGHDVVGIDDLSYGIPEQVPKGIEFQKLDIRSKDIYPVFKGVDVVFHLAAKNSLPDCQKDPVGTMDINVVGTANVFEAAKRAGVQKTVYAQSSVVEEGDNRLTGFYAISKFADGMLDEGYKGAFGLTTVAARYFNVYGPGQDYRRNPPPIMTKFIIKMLKGEAPILFEDDDRVNGRDYVYIDDVNDFHVMCIDDDRVNNKMFRIGSGKSIYLKEVFETLQKIMGVRTPAVIKPRPTDPEFKPAETLADITDTVALGWKPKTSLEDGLRAQVEYLKAEFAKGNIK
jgi:nucleoside-diphosphate-sugar epimerase